MLILRPLIRRHHEKFLWLIVLALLTGNLNGVLGVLFVQKVVHGLGGRTDTTAQIRAHFVRVDPARARLVGGGGNVDLSYLMPPPQNQGNSNACGSFSLSEILYALRIQRGETPSTYFSPWYHRFNTVGASDSYTNMDQNVAAVYAPNGGMVYHWRQEYPGQPNQAAYTHADAKSAYYSVFSTGGAGTFDQIAYEVETGHPVWILSQIRDGMYYASSSNPYSDNQGALHGAHFEVVTGVYGNWLKIEGSWGANYGQGGYWYLSRYGADTTTLEAAVVSLGPGVVWPRVQPLPTALPATPPPRPTVRLTPHPTAHPTARPTTAPTARVYVVQATHALRAAPRADSALGRVVRRGWRLKATGPVTPHWVQAATLDHRGAGWMLRAWVR